MGFYAPAQIVRDAQEHGVEVRPIDINFSDWDCTLEPHLSRQGGGLSHIAALATAAEDGGSHAVPQAPYLPLKRGGMEQVASPPPHRQAEFSSAIALPFGGGIGARSPAVPKPRLHPRHAAMQGDIWATHALRLGLRQVSGLSQAHALTIESVRGRGFDSVRDLWLRTRLPPAALEKLAQADAFGSLGLSRRDALWAVRALKRSGDKDDLPLFRRVAMPELEPDAQLPPMPPGEQVIEDYRHLHLSLKAHPVSFLRQDLDRRGILATARLSTLTSGPRVTVAGLVLVRQRPGDAKAIFMTLEDETGIANAILWLRTFELYRPTVLGARLISVTGKLQNESGVIHVVTDRVDDLSFLLRRLSEAPAPETLLRCDEVKRPNPGIRSEKHQQQREAARRKEEEIARATATKSGDNVQRPAVGRHRHPRAGDSLVTSLKQKPDLFDVPPAAAVMPKGRNFH
jgi:error-prone DNA polymerase